MTLIIIDPAELLINSSGGNVSVGPLQEAAGILHVHGNTYIDNGSDANKRLEFSYHPDYLNGTIQSNYNGNSYTELKLNALGASVSVNLPDDIIAVAALHVRNDMFIDSTNSPVQGVYFNYDTGTENGQIQSYKDKSTGTASRLVYKN